jgi:hypothetical protein
MPRFHFDIREDGSLVVDEVGYCLATKELARREAVASGASIAREAFANGKATLIVIDVREQGETLIKVTIKMNVEE